MGLPMEESAEESSSTPPLMPASELIPHLNTTSIRTKLYTFEELSAATGHFSQSNSLGRGSFSQVYHGELFNTKVAIKKFLNPDKNESQFVSEVLAFSRINHPNIVNMLGYCTDYSSRLLVLEFVPNKSLKIHLHGRKLLTVNWRNRMKIALGTAKGLAYLHNCNPKIIHRNIKSSCILLDSNFEPKIAGFEIAISLSHSVSHIMTDFKGTFGYMAPEYMKDKRLSIKADVFCFGIILLGLVTGKKPYSYSKDECAYLTTWAMPLLEFALEKNEYNVLVDSKLGNDYRKEEMGRMVCCAAACVYKPEENRPEMQQVVEALEGNLALELIWHPKKDKHYLQGPGPKPKRILEIST